MADELSESELEDDDLAKVVLLQAHFRGYLVRKWMHQLRRDFEVILEEEGLEPGLQVHWPHPTVCHPIFSKTKPQSRKVPPSQERRTVKSSSRPQDPRPQRASAAVQTESQIHPGSDQPQRDVSIERTEYPLQPGNKKSGVRVPQCQTQDPVPQKMKGVSDKNVSDKGVSDKGVETDDTQGMSLGTFACRNQEDILRLSDKFTSASLEQQPSDEDFGDLQEPAPPLSVGEAPAHTEHLQAADVDALRELRKNTALELLWIQQAINSRKNYLKIKAQMQ